MCVCYGNAGNVVHHIAQTFIQRRVDMDYFSNTETQTFEYNKIYYLKLFDKKWNDYNLNHSLDIKGNILSFNEYKDSMYRVLDFINNRPKIKIAEKDFIFPLIKTDKIEINIKGYIDAIDETNNIVFDWKTNNKQEDFTIAAKMYCYAYHKIYNKIPQAIYYYTKLDKIQGYNFTLEEILEFEEYLKNIANEIIDKGFNISKYESGDWTNIFNTYYKQCREEIIRRETEKNKINIKINVSIKNNMLFFDDSLPEDIKNILVKKYKYKVAGCEFSELFKKRIWDGYKRFFSRNSIPLGFIHDFEALIFDYNRYFNKNIVLNYIDLRDQEVVNTIYDTKFKDNSYTLYDFQEDCVVKALENEIGIIYVGTGGGKTLISSEIIRRLNRRSLYLVNRIELGEQVRDNLEEMLGVEVGLMSEGNIIIDKQITVASIQTIGAILKRKDKSTLALKKYLYNVSLVIADEAQNIKDVGYYGILRKNLVNCKYILGMSGTPFRT